MLEHVVGNSGIRSRCSCMSTEQASIGQNQVPNTSNVGESNSVPMNVDAPPIQDETHCSSPTDVEEARPKQISSI
ncbi:hypothetical protein Lal_00001199 [Lupinus albus]|nr:hypothetical protein Lal_00001199 [Lupinus albus]